jgi:hypothetical protein
LSFCASGAANAFLILFDGLFGFFLSICDLLRLGRERGRVFIGRSQGIEESEIDLVISNFFRLVR